MYLEAGLQGKKNSLKRRCKVETCDPVHGRVFLAVEDGRNPQLGGGRKTQTRPLTHSRRPCVSGGSDSVIGWPGRGLC